jgi:hypothetical protein
MNRGSSLDDEIDQFMFEHRFGVEVGNEEGDIIALYPSEPSDYKRESKIRRY